MFFPLFFCVCGCNSAHPGWLLGVHAFSIEKTNFNRKTKKLASQQICSNAKKRRTKSGAAVQLFPLRRARRHVIVGALYRVRAISSSIFCHSLATIDQTASHIYWRHILAFNAFAYRLIFNFAPCKCDKVISASRLWFCFSPLSLCPSSTSSRRQRVRTDAKQCLIATDDRANIIALDTSNHII